MWQVAHYLKWIFTEAENIFFDVFTTQGFFQEICVLHCLWFYFSVYQNKSRIITYKEEMFEKYLIIVYEG